MNQNPDPEFYREREGVINHIFKGIELHIFKHFVCIIKPWINKSFKN